MALTDEAINQCHVCMYEELLSHKWAGIQTKIKTDIKENLVSASMKSESCNTVKFVYTFTCPLIREPAAILSCDMKAIFTDPYLFEGDSCSRTRWEHTQPWAFSSVRKSRFHISSFLSPFSFLSLHFFLFFSVLQCSKECFLNRVAGVHWSDSTPMSHTHPMCLLLATLTKRGSEEKEGESEGAERGEGEESEEFDMLCAWVTCIKQRQGK